MKEHSVTIRRHTGEIDTLGQRDRSQDTTIASEVPAYVNALRGRLLEAARQLYAAAEYEVYIYPGEGWAVDENCYFINDDTGAIWNIGYAEYPLAKDREIRLLVAVER